MINFNIELGDGDVAVGVTKLSYTDTKAYYGLTFKDLVTPEEIGSSVRVKSTRNSVTITIKNKESLMVLKEAIGILERVLDGENIKELKDSINGLNLTELIKQRIKKEIDENKE